VTLHTAAGAVEVLSSGFRTPSLYIGWIDRPPAAASRFRLRLLIVNESDHRPKIRIVHVEGGHALFRAAGPHYWTDTVAAQVFSNKHRARQIRPCLSSCRIPAMTKRALRGKPRFPSSDLFRGIRLRINGGRRRL
jgi:hypothetical protein